MGQQTYTTSPRLLSLTDAKRKVILACAELFVTDCRLFLLGATERTIGAHFARYLMSQFDGYHVDCEYNCDGHAMRERSGGKTKLARLFEEKGIQRVYPDTVVHIRETTTNLLVVELKRSTNRKNRKDDFKKLEVFTADEIIGLGTAFRYNVGVFLEFRTGRQLWEKQELCARATWFERGLPYEPEVILRKRLG